MNNELLAVDALALVINRPPGIFLPQTLFLLILLSYQWDKPNRHYILFINPPIFPFCQEH